MGLSCLIPLQVIYTPEYSKHDQVFSKCFKTQISFLELIMCSLLFLTFKTRVISALVSDISTAHPFSLGYPHFTFMRREIVSNHADIRKDALGINLKCYWFNASFSVPQCYRSLFPNSNPKDRLLSWEWWTEPCLHLCPLTAFTSPTWNHAPRHLQVFSASPKPTHNCNLCLLLTAIELFSHKTFSLLFFQPEVYQKDDEYMAKSNVWD